ncbi:MAG: substrate-binding domain-containing protein [Micrococcales bacterium]|nr:substrate-binding domain-containing protein [Micrococcales bacterium]
MKRRTDKDSLLLVAAGAAVVALLLAGCTGGIPGNGPDDGPATSIGGGETAATDPTGVTGFEISDEFVQRIDGSTATIPLMTAALEELRGNADGMEFNTTPYAYDNLIEGEKDVIFVTAPSEGELAAAEAAGVELEVIPIVKDALVFLDNTANPVTGLSQQQVKDIYTGAVTNWSQVGGVDQAITPYQRPVDSGSQTLFLQLAMGETIPLDAPAELRPGAMDELIEVVSAYNNSEKALGFSVFYYAQEMYAKDNVRLLAIDQVEPTHASIADESYPYLTYYYAVVRSDEPEDSTARQLIEWCLTDEGQQVFSAASFVPLDAANLVDTADEYGFYGSTPENTSQSNGTGGPRGQSLLNGPSPCDEFDCLQLDDQGGYVSLSVPGYPEAEAAARAWFEALPPSEPVVVSGEGFDEPMELWVDLRVTTARGLLQVSRADIVPAGAGENYNREAATFRLVDGHRMELSDFFYDGVNYIEFINTNLLNEDSNQWLSSCETDWMCFAPKRLAPFTGLPADYPEFAFAHWGTSSLDIQFRQGNPFVTSRFANSGDSFVEISLPSDLSPYGMLWRINSESVGTLRVDHVQSTYLDTDPRDGVLNQAIDAWAASLSGTSAVLTYLNYDSSAVRAYCHAVDSSRSDVGNAAFDYQTGQLIETEP